MSASQPGTEGATDPNALLRRVGEHDADALAALYDRTGAVVYNLALRMLTDTADAEEIAADVFHYAWTHAAAWDPSRGNAIAWLLMLTRSRCLDRLRANDSRRRAEDPIRQAPQTVEPPDIAAAERSEHIRSALARLPDEQREAVTLACFGGLSHPELAQRLSLPLGTVKTRIRLGMAKLRDLLRTL